MNLYEYQAKKLLLKHDIPIPKGIVCGTLNEIQEVINSSKLTKWIVKCQIQSGGRGVSGGVKVFSTEQEIINFAKMWLGKRLITCQTDSIGLFVEKILIENVIDIERELYFSITIDKAKSIVVCITSMYGGVDIEKVSKNHSHHVYTIVLDTFIGFQPYQGRNLAYKLKLNDKQVSQFNKIFNNLSVIFFKYDLTLLEINPLAINNHGDLVCLDCKMSIDDNAMFRQSMLAKMCINNINDNERELLANRLGLNYVSLNGNIGCMVNGAGLAMSTMDLIELYNGSAANFLDVGGNTTKESIIEALKIILLDKKIKVLLINIFGGIVCCDLIASSVIEAISNIGIVLPIVVRLEGNNSNKGMDRLLKSKLNIININNFVLAVQKAVSLAG